MKKVTNAPSDAAPVVILVRPQIAENIGMVARAMMNCGLGSLRLVAPREDHVCAKAIAASSGAAEVLEQAEVYPTLAEAVADRTFVLATTARRREMAKPVLSPQRAIQALRQHVGRTAILFGAERTGLENDEVVIADALVEIPLNPQHSSLNLSQAVLIMGYEWFQAGLGQDNSRLEYGDSQPATKIELEAFFTHLETELIARGYFRFADKRARMKRNLRNIFARAGLTASEIKTLHSVVTDLVRKVD